jgi:aromatic amino acid aminotransferase I
MLGFQPGTLSGLVPMGLKPIPVALDAEGMVPSDMDRVLDEWDSAKQGKKPRFVLIVPSGQNPSGTTMQAARRKEFYAVAQKHNLIIVSDDPYRALVLSHESETPVEAAPSFLSLDVDGRVLDISSFSKVVAPGCRTGWVTGPKPLIERILRRNEVTTQAVSGFSQSAITSFLGALGGQDGWDKYLAHVAKQVRPRLAPQLTNREIASRG